MKRAVTVSSKGQVMIPARVRREAGLRPGDRLEVRCDQGQVVMEKTGVTHSLEALARLVRERYRGEDLEARLYQERARDDRREKTRRS